MKLFYALSLLQCASAAICTVDTECGSLVSAEFCKRLYEHPGMVSPTRGESLSYKSLTFRCCICAPTQAPTNEPTEAPTNAPTEAPTIAPTNAPTEAPTTTTSPGPPTCVSIAAGATDAWCDTNCNWNPPYCPATLCSCDGSSPNPTPSPPSPTPTVAPVPSPGAPVCPTPQAGPDSRALPTTVRSTYTGFMDTRFGDITSQIVRSVREGKLNTLFWSFREMVDGQVNAITDQGYRVTCANIITINNAVKAEGLGCLHVFISIGGWDYPFPCAECSGTADQYANAFDAFNRECQAMDPTFQGIAGMDVDWEGQSVDSGKPGYSNTWTVADVEKMTDIQLKIKSKGYKISIVAPESYLNPNSPKFNLNLANIDSWHADFPYHAANAYAAFQQVVKPDLTMIQFYEGWTKIACEIYGKEGATDYSQWSTNYPKDIANTNFRIPGSGNGSTKEVEIKTLAIMLDTIDKYVDGFPVDFGNTMDSWVGSDKADLQGTQTLHVQATQLVVGYANIYALHNHQPASCYNWACQAKVDPYKNIWVKGQIIAAVECCSAKRGKKTGGFTYWSASHDTLYTNSDLTSGTTQPEVKNFLQDISAGLDSCDSAEMNALCAEANTFLETWNPICA